MPGLVVVPPTVVVRPPTVPSTGERTPVLVPPLVPPNVVPTLATRPPVWLTTPPRLCETGWLPLPCTAVPSCWTTPPVATTRLPKGVPTPVASFTRLATCVSVALMGSMAVLAVRPTCSMGLDATPLEGRIDHVAGVAERARGVAHDVADFTRHRCVAARQGVAGLAEGLGERIDNAICHRRTQTRGRPHHLGDAHAGVHDVFDPLARSTQQLVGGAGAHLCFPALTQATDDLTGLIHHLAGGVGHRAQERSGGVLAKTGDDITRAGHGSPGLVNRVAQTGDGAAQRVVNIAQLAEASGHRLAHGAGRCRRRD